MDTLSVYRLLNEQTLAIIFLQLFKKMKRDSTPDEAAKISDQLLVIQAVGVEKCDHDIRVWNHVLFEANLTGR